MTAAALECIGMDVAVPGRTLVRDLSLTLAPGDCLAVLGRNGAGKTTTLGCLAGLGRPARGEVRIAGRPLPRWPRRRLACELGMLLQNHDHPFPATVLDSVLVGRHPHLGFLEWEGERDLECARQALEETGLQDLGHRDVATLSGGELRRLAVATLLAQDPRIFLLDEPVNHLDPRYQVQVMNLFSGKARNGRAIVVTLHEANLASRYCNRALLLFGDGEWLLGEPQEVVNAETLTRLYQTPVRALGAHDRPHFITA